MNKNQFVKSVVIGAYTAIVFVVLITIAGELYKVTGADGKVVNPIKDFLKALHGHHWVGKGIWEVALFALTTAGAYLINRNDMDGTTVGKHVKVLAWILGLGTLVLFAFFSYEYAIH